MLGQHELENGNTVRKDGREAVICRCRRGNVGPVLGTRPEWSGSLLFGLNDCRGNGAHTAIRLQFERRLLVHRSVLAGLGKAPFSSAFANCVRRKPTSSSLPRTSFFSTCKRRFSVKRNSRSLVVFATF